MLTRMLSGKVLRGGVRWCASLAAPASTPSSSPSRPVSLGFTPFEWNEDKEASWTAQHGNTSCDVREITKADLLRIFGARTLADKLLENFVMLDVRARDEVTNTIRLDIDVDQCYVVPYDEVSDAWDNLSLAQFYSKYIFPRPRKSDTVVLYGRGATDPRPFLVARLLMTKYNYTDVRVYKGGFVDFRGMDYEAWASVMIEKRASQKAEVVRERERLEQRRAEELERYRRERAKRQKH